jgi:hypothetical protein
MSLDKITHAVDIARERMVAADYEVVCVAKTYLGAVGRMAAMKARSRMRIAVDQAERASRRWARLVRHKTQRAALARGAA